MESGEFWSAYELFSKVGDRPSKVSSVQALLELLAQTLPLGCAKVGGAGYQKSFDTAREYVKAADSVLKDVGNIDDLEKITREVRLSLFRFDRILIFILLSLVPNVSTYH